MTTYRARVRFPDWIVKYFEETSCVVLKLRRSCDVLLPMMITQGCILTLDPDGNEFHSKINGRTYCFAREWLCDIEEIKPEVDWSTVKVDTKILVRDKGETCWRKRYFASSARGEFFCWPFGLTSWTTQKYNPEKWAFAKLAEDES